MHDILSEMISAAEGVAGANASCSCNSAKLRERMILEQIPVDEAGDFFEVEIPYIECVSCGYCFPDERAESLRHAAACAHFKLLTPAEIRDVRQALRLSRREFDEAFGIPPASMERWENGRLMQSRSMDTLLRALQNPSTAARLDRRILRSVGRESTSNVIEVSFGALSSLSFDERKSALDRQSTFKLSAVC